MIDFVLIDAHRAAKNLGTYCGPFSGIMILGMSCGIILFSKDTMATCGAVFLGMETARASLL